MANREKIEFGVCLDPSILAGGENNWQQMLNTADYNHLRDWTEKMRKASEHTSECPAELVVLPSRPPDHIVAAKVGGRPFGEIVFRDGETLWDLFGVAWKYVYEHSVNQKSKSFQRDFADVKKIPVGARIKFPVGLLYEDDVFNEAMEYTCEPTEQPVCFDDEAYVARAYNESPAPPNTLSPGMPGAIKGKLEWKNVQVNCTGAPVTILSATVEYEIYFDPRIRRVSTYGFGSSNENKVKWQADINSPENSNLKFNVDGQEFQIDAGGNLAYKSKAGAFNSVISASSKDGIVGELAGTERKTKLLRANIPNSNTKLEVDSSVKPSAKVTWEKVEIELEQTLTARFVDGETELLSVKITHKANVEIHSNALSSSLACVTVPIAVRLPKSVSQPTAPPATLSPWAVAGAVLLIIGGVVVIIVAVVGTGGSAGTGTPVTLPLGAGGYAMAVAGVGALTVGVVADQDKQFGMPSDGGI